MVVLVGWVGFVVHQRGMGSYLELEGLRGRGELELGRVG